ncbi:MAG: uroporphyrinogen-III synthase [Chloroflexota bacterium]
MKVLITRPRSQADSFANALADAGFEPVYLPVIEIRPVEDLTALDRALARINCYDWVVFTSVNGVEVVFERLFALTPTPLLMGEGQGVRVAAIGPKTAEALQKCGVTPDFVPEEYVAEAILPGLGDLRGCWVLLPRAEIARKALPEAIARAGGVAHEIAVYKTVPAQPDPNGLAALKSGVDAVTFTSPSTVENFVEIVRRAGLDPLHLPGNPKIACIGPITQKIAEEAGFVDLVVAEVYTTEGLVKLLRSGA